MYKKEGAREEAHGASSAAEGISKMAANAAEKRVKSSDRELTIKSLALGWSRWARPLLLLVPCVLVYHGEGTET